jgi:hypothetical protein
MFSDVCSLESPHAAHLCRVGRERPRAMISERTKVVRRAVKGRGVQQESMLIARFVRREVRRLRKASGEVLAGRVFVAGSLSISRRRPSYQLGCATLQFGIRQPHLNCRKRNVPFGKNWHNISTAV